MIEQFKNEIVRVLQSLSGDAVEKPLVVVYGYQEPEPKGYPAAHVIMDQVQTSSYDTGSVNIEMTGAILVEFLWRDFANEEIIKQVESVSDQIINKFSDRNIYLGMNGTVHTFDYSLGFFSSDETRPVTGIKIDFVGKKEKKLY